MPSLPLCTAKNTTSSREQLFCKQSFLGVDRKILELVLSSLLREKDEATGAHAGSLTAQLGRMIAIRQGK